MFNNLIESSSHTREFKRRGSFVLFTSAIYAVLFIVAGVASIYAYDARLDDQNLQIVTMLNPMDFPAPPAPVHNAAAPRPTTNQFTQTVREVAMASVNRPDIVPTNTSVTPNKSLPVPDHGSYVIGTRDLDAAPLGPTGPGTGGGSGNGTATPVVTIEPPPPPPVPVQQPKKIIPVSRLLNGLAISLPKPPYPAIAKTAGAHGPVNVQVVIDESGKVISASAVSGNPLLRVAAQQAAMGARFSPTILGAQPVKVSGVITYNFVLN
ncbi:MAG TPA: energy transducer TonB [Pyrinomonadaceae bacterium]|nr:energy transducer TonB [Pyrinomonadaceae bacterium]